MKTIIVLLLLLLSLCSPALAENYPLEIIQPRGGLTTTNRFYKAYPGLVYNVRAAVIGGTFPYIYELTQSPQGMTINATTGEITWTNPAEAGSPHTITLRVTDQENTQQTVTWTITVTTSGVRFLDAINGSNNAARGGTGTGTISNPWKDMQDFYGGPTNITDGTAAKANATYSGEFIYFRQGTYLANAMAIEAGERVSFLGNNKPQVWLAYPGETPVIETAGVAAPLFFGNSGADNIFFSGITFSATGGSKKILHIRAGANNVTLYKNVFNGNNFTGVTGQNDSLVFIMRSGDSGSRWSIQDNTAGGVLGNGYWLLGYNASRVLIESNWVSNVSGHSIGPKEGTAMWFIRGNRLTDNSSYGVNIQYSDTSGIQSGDIEVSYNYIKMPGHDAVALNTNHTINGKPIYVFRNTIIGNAVATKATETNGPFYFHNNVIINDVSGDKITRTAIIAPQRLVIGNNLGGVAADNIVDANGLLTPAYASYLGTHGWQIDGSCTPTNGGVEICGDGIDQDCSGADLVCDITPPTCSEFALQSPVESLSVPVSTLACSDAVSVTGYYWSESSNPPAIGATWQSAPATITVGGLGLRTVYLWARDAAGNISASRQATVQVNEGAAGPLSGAMRMGISGKVKVTPAGLGVLKFTP